jgi:glyoxylase-like metal-dependent hydrolase (beta-lactamase superfamily II)
MHPASPLQVEAFFDPATWTLSYLVLDRGTRHCALIDSVLDYDPHAGRTRPASADRLIARVRELGASVQWILETHVHADHLSAAAVSAARARRAHRHRREVIAVQRLLGPLFGAGDRPRARRPPVRPPVRRRRGLRHRRVARPRACTRPATPRPA